MPFIRLLEGIAIGFLMAVPIGAIGILCIRRTLSAGRRQGYITGLAGASADLVFSMISAFGIRLIYDFIAGHQHEIRIAGGVLLLVMGIVLMRSRRSPVPKEESIMQSTRLFLSTLFLGLTNPLVMFGYGAILSAIGVARYFQNYFSLTMLVLGVFLGSFLWFFALSNFVHRSRLLVTEGKLAIVNGVAGLLLVLAGLVAVWGGVRGM